MNDPVSVRYYYLMWALVGAIVGFLVGTAVTAATMQPEDLLQRCTAEDGHRNGEPCVWTDPDTGTRYIVDSSEYRD